MKYFGFVLVFVCCFFSCKQKQDEETMELYEAYLGQYKILNNHLMDYVLRDAVLYKESSKERQEFIGNIQRYSYKNDSILAPNELLSKSSIDSINRSHNEIIRKIQKNNSNERGQRFLAKFPSFSYEETWIEQHVKIKQSNLSLLKFYILSSPKISTSYPLLPKPQIIANQEINDSIHYSFLFGENIIPFIYQFDIDEDTLFLDNKIQNFSILKYNNQAFLSIKDTDQGDYSFKGKMNLYDPYSENIIVDDINIKFQLQ